PTAEADEHAGTGLEEAASGGDTAIGEEHAGSGLGAAPERRDPTAARDEHAGSGLGRPVVLGSSPPGHDRVAGDADPSSASAGPAAAAEALGAAGGSVAASRLVSAADALDELGRHALRQAQAAAVAERRPAQETGQLLAALDAAASSLRAASPETDSDAPFP